MRKTSLIISIVIVSMSFYYTFKDVSFSELQNAFLSLHYIYIVPSIFLITLSFFYKAVRWRYLIRPVKEVKTANLLSPLMVGFMGNMLPARAGEFIRAYLLGKKEHISFSASFATIVIERFFDLAMVILLLFFVLFNDSLSQGQSIINQKLMSYMFTFGWVSFIVCLFVIIFSLFLQFKNGLAMRIVDICIKPLPAKWGKKITSMLISFTEGLSILRDKHGFIVVMFLSFLIQLIAVFFNYPLYLAFKIENTLPIISSLTILCLTAEIFIALFPTPGFLGAFQAAYVIVLHEIFGIPKAIAVSFGIVAWFSAIGIIIVAGTFFVVRDKIPVGKISLTSGGSSNDLSDLQD